MSVPSFSQVPDPNKPPPARTLQSRDVLRLRLWLGCLLRRRRPRRRPGRLCGRVPWARRCLPGGASAVLGPWARRSLGRHSEHAGGPLLLLLLLLLRRQSGDDPGTLPGAPPARALRPRLARARCGAPGLTLTLRGTPRLPLRSALRARLPLGGGPSLPLGSGPRRPLSGAPRLALALRRAAGLALSGSPRLALPHALVSRLALGEAGHHRGHVAGGTGLRLRLLCAGRGPTVPGNRRTSGGSGCACGPVGNLHGWGSGTPCQLQSTLKHPSTVRNFARQCLETHVGSVWRASGLGGARSGKPFGELLVLRGGTPLEAFVHFSAFRSIHTCNGLPTDLDGAGLHQHWSLKGPLWWVLDETGPHHIGILRRASG